MLGRLLVAVVTVLPACRSFGSGEAPAPVDGGTADVGTGAGVLDAGSDAPTADVDASSTDGASPPARGCASRIGVFCADFDTGPLEQGWTSFAAGNGTAALAPSTWSLPNALLMTLPSAEMYNGPQLTKLVEGSFTRLRCGAHVARRTVGANLLEMMNLEVQTSSGATVVLKLYMSASSGNLHADPSQETAPANLAFAPEEFHAVALEVEGPQARIYIDGNGVGMVGTGVASAPTNATFILGPRGKEGASSDWSLLYDDAICERTN